MKSLLHVPQTGEQSRKDDYPSGKHQYLPGLHAKSFDTMNQNPGQINEMMNNMNNAEYRRMFDPPAFQPDPEPAAGKEKKEERRKQKEFSIKDIPPPHRIKGDA